MEQRPKLELEINKPTHIRLLYDEPIVGESQYGKYYLYAVRNGDNQTEYSYFAPVEVHEQLSKYNSEEALIITKLAVQRGKKVVTTYEVKKAKRSVDNNEQPKESPSNSFLSAMEKSFEEATVIQKKFNSVNLNQIAVTLFIQRTKGNHQFN